MIQNNQAVLKLILFVIHCFTSNNRIKLMTKTLIVPAIWNNTKNQRRILQWKHPLADQNQTWLEYD